MLCSWLNHRKILIFSQSLSFINVAKSLSIFSDRSYCVDFVGASVSSIKAMEVVDHGCFWLFFLGENYTFICFCVCLDI